MNLVETIKSMVDEGYMISFSKADLPMDGIYITIKKDGTNARQIIPEDKLKSLHLSSDELLIKIIKNLKERYYL